MMSEEHWVSVDKVAEHLEVTKTSVYRWIEKRRLPAHRVGRLYRFKISEIDRWVKENDSRKKKPAGSQKSKAKSKRGR